MKRRDLENKIRASFDASTPDLLDRIEESCRGQLPQREPFEQTAEGKMRILPPTPRRILAAALCLLLFVGGVFVGRISPAEDVGSTPVADTFVYIDVNPSVELSVNEDNRVVECVGANEDASAILSGLDLDGVELNTAISAIVGAMYANGYLSDTANSILVSVDSPSEQRTDNLLIEITDKINGFFNRSSLECSIIAQGVNVDEDLRQRALASGVSVGKMHLVDKMLEGIESLGEYDAPTLAGMSIQELNIIYSNNWDKGNTDKFDKDTVSGSVGGYLGEDQIRSVVLSSLGVNDGSIKSIDVEMKLDGEGMYKKLTYFVTVRLNDSTSVYDLKIDCLSGELIERNERIEDDTFGNGIFDFPDFADPSGNGQIGEPR